jgi:polysaccharide export outer membrane protein
MRVFVLIGFLQFALFALALGDPQPKAQPIQEVVAEGESNYNLAPNDLIEIRVFQEEDLHSKLRISKDGTITFPLIGVVNIGGKTPQDAAKVIRDLLQKDYLVNPQVSITVSEYTKRRFTVLGQVQKPGAYEMPDRDSLTLLQAIGMAGGYTRIANPSKITLKRIVHGQETIMKLNAKSMANEGASSTFEIQAGDVISVGESIF